ncbi:MAG: protein kinase [Mogibacterium sp.]|nr:protein kinase [Mogibacterium sp.]
MADIQTSIRKNQKIKLLNGQTVTVTGKIGEGGQGIVYRVKVDGTNEEKAMKWYFMYKINDPKSFCSNLADNVATGSPSETFVWPEQLTEVTNGSFGYIMEIIPDRYKALSKYLQARVSFKSCSAMVTAAINIVEAFQQLINKGYSFQDINDGSFKIDPTTGDVLICDCDNVVSFGKASGISGKARYKAPEVVRGDTLPNKVTDRYSLAVILFLLLVGNHPLEGARSNVPCMTGKYERRFYGQEPVFMFDEQLDVNRPVPGLHRNAIALWPCYPDFIRKAFIRSFSQDSLLRSEGRLIEQEWLMLLVRLKSCIVRCMNCGCEYFAESTIATACPDCMAYNTPPGYLRFDKKRTNVEITIPIADGAKLYEAELDERSKDYNTVSAEILVKPGKYGLKNLSKSVWEITAPGGKTVKKAPGEVAVLGTGFRIDFGNGVTAEIVANSR